MESDFTVESVLKEIKKNLGKYESTIKDCEENPSKKKISEAESTKKKLENKIKMVKLIITNEEDSSLLDSYQELYNDLNKKLNSVVKKQEKNKGKKNNSELFNSSHRHDIENNDNINMIDDEEQNLKTRMRRSTDIDNDLYNQEDESTENVVKTLKKVSFLGKIFGKINCQEKKGKLLFGCVLVIICFFGLRLIFYRNNK